MNCHLVAVEVGVESGTYQRMQLDGLAFDQHRLERLYTEPMQGRRPFSITGCSRMTSSRISHTIGLSFSTSRLAALMVLAMPMISSLLKIKGLNNSSAIFFGKPH